MSVDCNSHPLEGCQGGEGLTLLNRPLKFKRGDKGPFIVDIQEMFAKLGFDPGEPEGVFVAKTEDAVRVFQSEYGLEVTGIVDPKTLKFLYDEADPEGYPTALIEGQEAHGEEHEIYADEHRVLADDKYGIPDGGHEVPTDGYEPPDVGHAAPKDEHETPDDGHDIPFEGHESEEDAKLTQISTGEASVNGKELGADEELLVDLAEAGPASATDATAPEHTIVISLSEHALGLYQGNQLIKRYPVAHGKPSTPTPVGTHRVLEKVLHPGGALGTRWIGFTYQMHGIHGTNRPELIGQEVSNGCVRMHNSNVEELYDIVNVGTPVVVMVSPVQSWSDLGKPAGQTGAGSGQTGKPIGKPTGTPTGILDPAAPQPKDPVGPSPGRTYTVQPGDSIWSIAKRFGTTVDAIVAANDIRNPDIIYPGEVLKIP